MASVFWALGARRDLREVFEYIAVDSHAYAEANEDRIVAATERLASFPRLGRVVPEYNNRSIRELIVGNYRVVYRLRLQQVWIVAVVHARQDLDRRHRLAGESP